MTKQRTKQQREELEAMIMLFGVVAFMVITFFYVLFNGYPF